MKDIFKVLFYIVVTILIIANGIYMNKKNDNIHVNNKKVCYMDRGVSVKQVGSYIEIYKDNKLLYKLYIKDK